MQEATSDGKDITVKTILLHSSGENIETGLLKITPAKSNDPQAMGSCITYAKRYQLGALIGICESADDDGNAASAVAKPKQQSDAKKYKCSECGCEITKQNADFFASKGQPPKCRACYDRGEIKTGAK